MSFATPLPFYFHLHQITFSISSLCLYVSGLAFVSFQSVYYLLVGAINPLAFKVIINVCSYCNFLNCFGFVIIGLFLLLCFLPREVPLVFFVRLTWWYWILLGFACLSNLNDILIGSLNCMFSPFIPLNIDCHSLLNYRVSVENQLIVWSGFPFMLFLFFPCCF